MLVAFAMPLAGQNRAGRDRQGQMRNAPAVNQGRGNGAASQKRDTARINMPDVIIDEEEIPDSLLHPRWPVQRTTPLTFDDLSQGSYDLKRPDNMQQTVEYNDSLDRYIIGYKIDGTYINDAR